MLSPCCLTAVIRGPPFARSAGRSYEISKAEADDAITALRNGYPLDMQHLIDAEVMDEMPVAVCEEVRSILEMYRHINNSLIRLPQDAQDRVRESRWFPFRGFDGNDETEHYSYVTYLLEGRGLWRESHAEDNSFNTHLLRCGSIERC